MPADPPYLKKQWWMTGLVDKKSGDSVLMICDQGVGIPQTIPSEFLRKHSLFLRRQKDGEIIAVAIKEGVSSKPDVGRGRGLTYMLDFVQAINSLPNVKAKLVIYSGYGLYISDENGPRSGELNHDVGGRVG